MQPSGLIFDCDGTLVDSMPLHWRAWDIVCKRHGIEFSEKRHYAMGGMPSRKILALLKEEQGLDFDPIEVSHEKEVAYLPLMSQVGLIEPVVAIAREHRGRIPMAVATGGRKQFIRPLLERLEIVDDVANPKPAPDTFLKAAALMGVPAEECRAYEDTELGMESIRAAGMEAIDIREIPGVLPASLR